MAAADRQAGGGIGLPRQAVQTLSKHVLSYLKHLFETHAGPGGTWMSSQTKVFVNKVQNHQQDAEAEAAARLLSQPELDFNAFLAYMTSPDSAITVPPRDGDLSWPLASYFISSSHNTYLTGNQLSSQSTTGAYTNVLLRGCRCVEIDVWDGDGSDAEADSSDDELASRRAAFKEKMSELREKHHAKSAWDAYDHIKTKLLDSVTGHRDKASLGKKAEEERAATEGEPEVAVVEPRVLHGYTLTREVPFRDVCVAIGESAFAVTDLPLIVSLEVHCSAQQQGVMVDIMKETWAGLLVAEPEAEAEEELPSPDQLRRKILIKVKYAPPPSPPPDSPVERVESNASGEQPAADADAKQKKPPKTIQELSRLGIYTRGVSFKSWAQPEATMPTHVFSLSETKFLDHHAKQRAELFGHNRSYLMRAYPSGLRIGSSNLNPAVFWGGGAQVVALNWQQTDEGIMLNEGMFAGTGGYVLKPEGYRPDLKSKASPNTSITRIDLLSLSLTFLAAQSIPLPPNDKSSKSFRPYIKVALHVDASSPSSSSSSDDKNEGHEAAEHKARTRTHKGCDVDFQAEKLEFKNVPALVEELTFVRFTVRDDEIGRDDLAAWACVRLDRLGQGYRFVHLIDAKGAVTDGVVLVKVEKILA